MDCSSYFGIKQAMDVKIRTCALGLGLSLRDGAIFAA